MVPPVVPCHDGLLQRLKPAPWIVSENKLAANVVIIQRWWGSLAGTVEEVAVDSTLKYVHYEN